MHCLRLSRSRAKTAATWLEALWTHEELLEDESRRVTVTEQPPAPSRPSSARDAVSVVLRFRDFMAAPPGQDVTYVGNDTELWTSQLPTNTTVSLSPARLCLESTLPLRTAKIHISSRKACCSASLLPTTALAT